MNFAHRMLIRQHGPPMRVLVCGSRPWADRMAIRNALAKLPAGSTVIEGEARGADRLAREVAESLGLTVERWPADWKAHGRRAGILRNLAMLDTRPDMVLAFQVGRSPGTQHTVDEATRRGIPVEVWRVD